MAISRVVAVNRDTITVTVTDVGSEETEDDIVRSARRAAEGRKHLSHGYRISRAVPVPDNPIMAVVTLDRSP